MSSAVLASHTAKALQFLDKDRLVELALELSDVPNPLGEEAAIAQLLYRKMRDEGLISSLRPFAPMRSNVLGILRGTGQGRSLMLTGHLESGSKKNAPWPKARIDGEWISGKGIWNMKGVLAAYVIAISAVRKAGIELAGDVLIAGVAGAHDQTTVDSRIKGDGIQGYSVGTVQLLAQGVTADVSVVGEPTSFKLVKQHFGVTAIRIDIRVEQSSSRVIDDLTSNLFPDADVMGPTAATIQALREWIPKYKRKNRLDDVDPWVHISAIEGGGPWSPYPAMSSSLYVFAGTRPGEQAEAVLREIQSVLDKVRRGRADLHIDTQIFFNEPGPFVSDDNPIVTGIMAAHSNVFGKPPVCTVVPWHSDASPLVRSGIAAVNYGPPGEFSPTRGEAVKIQDLFDCARVYAGLIVQVCGLQDLPTTANKD